MPTVNEVVSAKEDSIANNGGTTAVAAVTAPKKKRPALTIKIQNSSFCEQEDDLVSELEKSPNLYISGINLTKSFSSTSIMHNVVAACINYLHIPRDLWLNLGLISKH